jgi:hypothetical protein
MSLTGITPTKTKETTEEKVQKAILRVSRNRLDVPPECHEEFAALLTPPMLKVVERFERPIDWTQVRTQVEIGIEEAIKTDLGEEMSHPLIIERLPAVIQAFQDDLPSLLMNVMANR